MILALVAVFLGGAAVALQVPINAVLGRASGSFLLAAAISFGVGFVALFVLAALRGNLSGLSNLSDVPWWGWTGGLLGAYFVWANVSSVGFLGVVTLFAALVLGQMVMSLVLDATGAFGVAKEPISWSRIAGISMVLFGVVLSRI